MPGVSARSFLRRSFARVAAAAGLCAALSGQAFAADSVTEAADALRSDPARTQVSKDLEKLQAEFSVRHPDIALVILDRDKIDFAMGQRGLEEESFVVGAIYKEVGAELNPSLYLGIMGNFGEGEAGSDSKNIGQEGRKLCILTPRDPNPNTVSKLKGFLQTVEYRDIVPARLFDDRQFDKLSLHHELWHCLDNRYIPEYESKGFSKDFSKAGWEAFVLLHKIEVFADLGRIVDTAEAGGDWRAQLDELRTLRMAVAALEGPMYARAYYLQQENPMHDTALVYHTAPALTLMEQKLDEIGLDKFERMSFEQKRELVYEVTEAGALSLEEIRILGDFFEKGDIGQSAVSESVRYFLAHVVAAVNKTIIDNDPQQVYEPVPAGMADNKLARARASDDMPDPERRLLKDSYNALMRDAPVEIGTRARELGSFSQENLQQAAALWIDDMRDYMEHKKGPEAALELRLNLLRALIREGWLQKPNPQFRQMSHMR